MPKLDDILQDMLVALANGGKLDGLQSLDTATFTTPKPSPGQTGPNDQSIWFWEKQPNGASTDPGFLGQIVHLNCWARVMAEMHNDDNLGWMTVCNSITWSPVKVDVKLGNNPFRLTLPLTDKFVIKTVFLGSGHNPGKGWWPLEAEVDSSFFQVFLYDITGKTSSDDPDPVPSEVFDHDDFMPDPGAAAVPPPALNPGDQVDMTVAHKHFVCVVTSLVCCKERADFEPGAVVNLGRFVPHYMVMTNMPVEGILGAIRIERPAQSGYQGTSSEPPRPPMQHANMSQDIKALVVADTNAFRADDIVLSVNMPFWDNIFDLILPVPSTQAQLNDSLKVVNDEPAQRTLPNALGLLDYSKIQNTLAGMLKGGVAGFIAQSTAPGGPGVPVVAPALGAFGGAEAQTLVFSRPGLRILHPDLSTSLLFGPFVRLVYGASGLSKADLLPRRQVDAVKWARQGEFDSIHLAPRMLADLLVFRGDLSAETSTLSEIMMAPFCEHDCLHTHWRWGANWADSRMAKLLRNPQGIKGFAPGNDAKFSGTGVPYAEFGAPMVPLNQEVSISFESEHVFNYAGSVAKNVVPGVWQPVYHHGSAYALSIADPLVSLLVSVFTGCLFDQVAGQFSEFYWTLRFQDTMDGPLERLVIDDVDVARFMGL
jgi:hypothetical protein